MIMKTIIAGCFLLVVITKSHSQSRFEPGAVITNAGDTLRGYIQYRNWEINPKYFSFRMDEGAVVKNYSVYELRHVNIYNKDVYEKFILSKDMLPVNINGLEYDGEVKSLRDTVFLRMLVAGTKLKLYELVDSKVHYYLLENGEDEPNELFYRVYKKNPDRKYAFGGNSSTVTYKIYKDQLMKYAFTDAELTKRINQTEYKAADLKKIVIDINKNNGGEIITEALTKNVMFYAGTGIGLNSLNFSGNNYREINNLNSSPSIGMIFKAGMDIASLRSLNRLFLRAELTYSKFAYEGTANFQVNNQTLTRDYYLNINSFTPSLSINYKILHSGYIDLYAGAGLGYNFSSYPQNYAITKNNSGGEGSKTEEFLIYKKNWLELPTLRAGVIYNKFLFDISSRIAGSPTEYMFIKTNFKTTSFTVSYFFN